MPLLLGGAALRESHEALESYAREELEVLLPSGEFDCAKASWVMSLS